MSFLSIEEALSIISGSSRYEHYLLVSEIMKILAILLEESEKIWCIVGLLHDLDYDQVEEVSKYGVFAAEQLKDKLPEDALYAIKAHDTRTGIEPKTLLDESLIFADSLAIFLESNKDLHVARNIFTAKPWIQGVLSQYVEKYELDILDILEQLSV